MERTARAHRSRQASSLATLAMCAAWIASCEREPAGPSGATNKSVGSRDHPPHALLETHEALVASTKQRIDVSDGGGRAWIEIEDGTTPVARRDQPFRASIAFEVGEHGVAEGGSIFLQVSPFWGWSTPQVDDPAGPGFTRVTAEADGATFECETIDQQLLAARVGGRALLAGELVRFDYGAGALGAEADDFAELESFFWIAVDGDGDGVRKVLADSPHVRVLPGPPARLIVHAPSVVRPGEPFDVQVALLDAEGNACRDARGRLELVDPPAGLSSFVGTLAGDANEIRGSSSFACTIDRASTARLRLRCRVEGLDAELEAESNPCVVTATGPRIQWADLHGHSSRSDGTGTPREWFDYAVDFAALDAVALTDHDHWGLLPLDRHPEIVAEIVAAARAVDRPGEFTALVGFEWTSWLHGHRNVVYFDDSAEIYSSIDERWDSPRELFDALRGKRALSIPHHPAGGPIAIDWTTVGAPDDEPLVEICSAHGSSESEDSPRRIYSSKPGAFVRDALERGLVFGFVASGDSHDGHPGLAHVGSHYPTGGVAAVLAEENTREALHEALRDRRTYATTGARIVLRFALGGHRMGEIASAATLGKRAQVYVEAIGTAPIRTVEIVRKGETITIGEGDGGREIAVSGSFDDLASGDWVYARVVQEDGAMAWSSPIFVR